MPCRDGERLRPSTLLDGGGDLGRFAALAKGDVDDAKASKPVRLFACACEGDAGEEDDPAEDDASLAATAAANGEGDVLDDAKGEAEPLPPKAFALEPEVAPVHDAMDGCLPPKRRGPGTDANGELVEAYAMNPPCNGVSTAKRCED